VNVAWTRTIDPTDPAIDVATVKLHCRGASSTVEDPWFADKVKAATGLAESYLNRGLMPQTWKLAQDRFSPIIWLPMAAPLNGDPTVQYYDGDGNLQTVDPSIYLVDVVSEPARLVLAPGKVWPVIQPRRASAVPVTYPVGFADASKIPAEIISGELLLIEHWYTNRGAALVGASAAVQTIPFGLDALWGSHVVHWREPHDWLDGYGYGNGSSC
jgi:uncharacterized phiE125 gp8 family phage protein